MIMAPDHPDDQATQITLPDIPGFRVQRQLGRGGMGAVYLARQQAGLDRDVAVKTVLSDRTEPYFRKRFLDEGQRQAELHHPNILPIFAAGEHNDALFLVMHYARSGTLREKLRDGGLGTDESIAIITQVVKALRHAHHEISPPLAHLDIKPENILFDGDNVLLSDFGIARRIATGSGAATVVAGDPRYWAPEQQENKESTKSDIYALGVMFHEVLAGVRPTKGLGAMPHGKRTQCLRRSLPASARRFAPLISSCIDDDPDRRPTASEALSALEHRPGHRRSWAGALSAVAVSLLSVAIFSKDTRAVAGLVWRSIFPESSYAVHFELQPQEAELWIDGSLQLMRTVRLSEGEHLIALVADDRVGQAHTIAVEGESSRSYSLDGPPQQSDAAYRDFMLNFGVSEGARESSPTDPALLALLELDRASRDDPRAVAHRVRKLSALALAGDRYAATALFYAAFEEVKGVGSVESYLPGLEMASAQGYALASLLEALYVMQVLLDNGTTFDRSPHAFVRVVELLQRAGDQGLPDTAALVARSAGVPLSRIR